MEKPFDIRERTFLFADAILDVVIALLKIPEADVVRYQIAKSGTSVGANVEESDGAESKADKCKSFVIARKETKETRFWLKLIAKRWPSVKNAPDLIQEATEIINILSAIIAKLRKS